MITDGIRKSKPCPQRTLHVQGFEVTGHGSSRLQWPIGSRPIPRIGTVNLLCLCITQIKISCFGSYAEHLSPIRYRPPSGRIAHNQTPCGAKGPPLQMKHQSIK